MRHPGLKALAALAVVCVTLAFWPDDTFAQRRRLRTPGRTGIKSRPDKEPSEKKEEGGVQSVAAAPNGDPLARFPQATTALGTDSSTLRNEFAAAQSIYNKLKPEQFIAARLLVRDVRERYSGVEITAEDLFRGLANEKSYRTTLKAKGLTGGQVDQLMGRLREKMTQLLQD